jgi:O-methyltransferase
METNRERNEVTFKLLQAVLHHTKRRITDPLTSIASISRKSQLAYGNSALHYRHCAEILILAVQYIDGASVSGGVAEFGTQTGRTAKILAVAMNSFHLHDRVLHLFDSFKGLPKSSEVCPHIQDGTWAPGTLKGITPISLESLVKPYHTNTEIYAGWFKETIGLLTGPLALIHVDCDLYESTMDALTLPFHNGWISPGAIVLFDDWNCNKAGIHYGERRAWKELVDRFEINCSDEGSYGWAGHKFIVHDYNKNERKGLE